MKLKRFLAGLIISAGLVVARPLGPVHISYTPLGIWPLCDAGISMPGCGPDMPRLWLEVEYMSLAGGGIRVLRERVVEKPGVEK